jgi:hypothetical protein
MLLVVALQEPTLISGIQYPFKLHILFSIDIDFSNICGSQIFFGMQITNFSCYKAHRHWLEYVKQPKWHQKIQIICMVCATLLCGYDSIGVLTPKGPKAIFKPFLKFGQAIVKTIFIKNS